MFLFLSPDDAGQVSRRLIGCFLLRQQLGIRRGFQARILFRLKAHGFGGRAVPRGLGLRLTGSARHLLALLDGPHILLGGIIRRGGCAAGRGDGKEKDKHDACRKKERPRGMLYSLFTDGSAQSESPLIPNLRRRCTRRYAGFRRPEAQIQSHGPEGRAPTGTTSPGGGPAVPRSPGPRLRFPICSSDARSLEASSRGCSGPGPNDEPRRPATRLRSGLRVRTGSYLMSLKDASASTRMQLVEKSTSL